MHYPRNLCTCSTAFLISSLAQVVKTTIFRYLQSIVQETTVMFIQYIVKRQKLQYTTVLSARDVLNLIQHIMGLNFASERYHLSIEWIVSTAWYGYCMDSRSCYMFTLLYRLRSVTQLPNEFAQCFQYQPFTHKMSYITCGIYDMYCSTVDVIYRESMSSCHL